MVTFVLSRTVSLTHGVKLLNYFFAFTPPPGQGSGSLTPEARMIREKIKAF